jgi:hypothetical protein
MIAIGMNALPVFIAEFISAHVIPLLIGQDHSPLKTRAGHHLLAIANPLPVG